MIPSPRQSLLDLLEAPEPLTSIELRPPRANLSPADSREAWIDANHSLRRLLQMETVVFITDNAVGRREEENLQHLISNVGPDAGPGRIVPFLTCKHTLEYCTWYAQRAAQSGYRALVVLGGDRHDGAERCVPHAWQLRKIIRQALPQMTLGGWANPYREPVEQISFLQDGTFEADFYLTQVVSHLDIAPVEGFLSEAARRCVKLPGIFGVFYYRSANARTLRRLSEFLPVPIERLEREFASGASAEEICARTIRALRRLGVTRVYVSNLPTADSHRVLARLKRLLEG